jgi:hypothetical protein
VIFDLPYQDRLHTILLRYREEKNKDIGIDVCALIRLYGPRDEKNGFESAKQTTIIRYIGLQGNCNIETKVITTHSRDNRNKIRNRSDGPEYGQELKSLKYAVRVEHSYKSCSPLDFGTTIHIVPKEYAVKSLHKKDKPLPTKVVSQDVTKSQLSSRVNPANNVEDDAANALSKIIKNVVESLNTRSQQIAHV